MVKMATVRSNPPTQTLVWAICEFWGNVPPRTLPSALGPSFRKRIMATRVAHSFSSLARSCLTHDSRRDRLYLR